MSIRWALSTAICIAALVALAGARADGPRPPDADLFAKAVVVVEGDVLEVAVTPGAIDRYGAQPGSVVVTLTPRAVEKGMATVGEPLTFQGETILRTGDLDGPISAIPPTLNVGDRVRVILVQDRDRLVVPSWRAFRLVEQARPRFPKPP